MSIIHKRVACIGGSDFFDRHTRIAGNDEPLVFVWLRTCEPSEISRGGSTTLVKGFDNDGLRQRLLSMLSSVQQIIASSDILFSVVALIKVQSELNLIVPLAFDSLWIY